MSFISSWFGIEDYVLQIPVQHIADIFCILLWLPPTHDLTGHNSLSIDQPVKETSFISVCHAACQGIIKIGFMEPMDGD